MYNVASMIGCYIFETARRSCGGNYYWVEKEQQPILIAGEPDFAVSIKAWDKVKERLKNGKEDEFADNKEDTTSYDILLNLYDRENIVETSEKIIRKLNEYGFRKVAFAAALDCNDGFFNTPIKLKIKLESRNE